MTKFRVGTYYGDQKLFGRNDGACLYTTGILRAIFGAENVLHLFPHGDLSRYGTFDLHWMADWGEDALGYEKFELPSPSVYITSDTHLGYEYRLSRARRCDWVFCNQNKAVRDFVADGIDPKRCFWLPHAFDPLAYSRGVFNPSLGDWDREAVPLKRYDVCFVGNLNDRNRVSHLDRLFKEFPNSFYWGVQRFHEAAEKFNQSRIVFNVSSRKELNMRHFEALGAGAFLLSDNIPESENVFKEGEHFVGYDNMDDMIEKAHYYLDPRHEADRERIARAGHIEAVSKHTYLHRVLAVLDTMGVPFDREAAEKLLPAIPAAADAHAQQPVAA